MTLLYSCSIWLFMYISLMLPTHATAAARNRTIDDTYGDSVTGQMPWYSANWNVGQSCPGCAVHPETAEAFMGSWHDTTSNCPKHSSVHNVMLTFNGTAVWVYCILANCETQGITTFANMSFELDGVPAATYSHVPDVSANDFEYNVTVFSTTGLSNAEHTLVMTSVQGTEASLMLFDWAEYTFEDGVSALSSLSATTSSQPNSTAQLSSNLVTATVTVTFTSAGINLRVNSALGMISIVVLVRLAL